MKRFFKINFFTVLFTVFLVWLTFYLGFPWLKGCDRMSSIDLESLSCIRPKFPGILNFYVLPFVLVLYFVAGTINFFLEKRKIGNFLKIIFLILAYVSIVGFYYHLSWKYQCRAFPVGINKDPRMQKNVMKCPAIYNPFEWDKFQFEFQQEWENLLRLRELKEQ